MKMIKNVNFDPYTGMCNEPKTLNLMIKVEIPVSELDDVDTELFLDEVNKKLRLMLEENEMWKKMYKDSLNKRIEKLKQDIDILKYKRNNI